MPDDLHQRVAPTSAGPAPLGDSARLLASRRFLPLFVVQALGAFNDNVFKNAFVALITFSLAAELEMGVALLGAIAAGVFVLPFALFAPIAGEIADRVDKAAMMRVVKAIEIVLMALASWALFAENVPALYGLLFLMGAQSALFGPNKYGVLPQYLSSSDLVRANGYIQGATFLAILGGTILGANLVLTNDGLFLTALTVLGVAIVGFVVSLWLPSAPPAESMRQSWREMVGAALDATRDRGLRDYAPFVALFGVTAAAIQFAAPEVGPLAGEQGAMITLAGGFFLVLALFWPSIRDGVEVARSQPRAWRAILAIAWFWFAAASFMALMPAYVSERLGGDVTVWTLLLSAFSIGVAIGSVLSGMIFRGRVRIGFAPWGAVLIAVFSIDLMFATAAAQANAAEALIDWRAFLASAAGLRVCFDFVALAICAGIYVTPLNAVYQSAAPQDARGRVVAASNMIGATLMTLSSGVVAGLVAAGLTAEEVYAVIGGTGLFAGLAIARYSEETLLGRFARAIWPTSEPVEPAD